MNLPDRVHDYHEQQEIRMRTVRFRGWSSSLLTFALLAFGLAGCDGGSGTSLSSLGLQDDFDSCEFFGRYNDQVCDNNCAHPDPDCDSAAIRNIDAEGPTMCVALRGNGDRIPAHFAGLARITENHGLISGVAGGSSAAFSALLVESVQKNASVRCADCSATEKGQRASLLLKSIFGYIDAISVSEDFLAAQSYAALLSEIEASGLDQALANGSPQATEDLQVLLNSERFRSLINPQVFQLLRHSPDPEFHAADIFRGMQMAATFDTSDQNILVRPGLLNFDGLAEQIGRAADFFVEADLQQFINACTAVSVGKSWSEIAAYDTGNGSCGQLFQTPLNGYLQRRAESSQLKQAVGEFMHTLIPTAVMEGESVSQWKDAYDAYQQAAPVSIQYNFNDIRFGYFGASNDLQANLDNRNNYIDEKTRRFRAHPAATWSEALRYSPAEPGLSRLL